MILTCSVVHTVLVVKQNKCHSLQIQICSQSQTFSYISDWIWVIQINTNASHFLSTSLFQCQTTTCFSHVTRDLSTFILLETIIKNFWLHFLPLQFCPPSLLPSPGFFTCPSSVAVSVVPPQRQNDPQAVNLNEAESWAGTDRTRPYGSVSDRGMRGVRRRQGGRGQGWRVRTEQGRGWGKLTWQNEREQKWGYKLRTEQLKWLRKKRVNVTLSPGGGRRRNTEVHREEQITWH